MGPYEIFYELYSSWNVPISQYFVTQFSTDTSVTHLSKMTFYKELTRAGKYWLNISTNDGLGLPYQILTMHRRKKARAQQ